MKRTVLSILFLCLLITAFGCNKTPQDELVTSSYLANTKWEQQLEENNEGYQYKVAFDETGTIGWDMMGGLPMFKLDGVVWMEVESFIPSTDGSEPQYFCKPWALSFTLTADEMLRIKKYDLDTKQQVGEELLFKRIVEGNKGTVRKTGDGSVVS